MRFHCGPIPDTPDFVPEEPWKALKEPTPWVMQLLALPVAFMTVVLVGALWTWLTPLEQVVKETKFGFWAIAAFVWLIPVHEAVHALVHPGRGISERTCIGVWPSHCLFYAHCHGPMSRERFIAILSAPFIVLSLVPLGVSALFSVVHPLLLSCSIVNALLACGDLLGVMLLVWQIPRGATIQNQSWRTYWHT